MNESEAAAYLKASRTTLWRIRRSGALPFYRVGGQIRYSVGDLKAWLREHREATAVHERRAEYFRAAPGNAHEHAWKAAVEAQDWSFHEAATNALTHGLHPYPAKFPPQIPARLIEILTRAGAVVLDPFCGSGTTLVEALRLDRAAVGTDVNPVAVLVSEAKTQRLDPGGELALEQLAQGVDADISRERGEVLLFSTYWPACSPVPPPPVPNLDRWFGPTAVRELGLLLARISRLEDVPARTVARAVLSSILVSVSNQDSETRYTSRPKNLAPGEVLAAFLRKLVHVRGLLAAFRDSTSSRPARVLLADARRLSASELGPVDAIVTSPPYANAFDYHLYHRHRMYWLGLEPAQLRRVEIGSHLNYQRHGDGIATYQRDMSLCLASLASILRPGAPCAFVVGESLFFGQVIDNAEIIAAAATSAGFECLTVVKRRIHPVKRSMIMAARRARVESIVVLVRR